MGGRLRVGIVGAGLMGRWHAHAAGRARGRLVGVVDADRGAADTLAARCGAPSFGSLEELLSAARPEVLHVCTPLASHEALAEAAIEAGLHVLVEKPLADRAEEVGRLYARAARRGVLLAPVHQYAFQDGVLHTLRGLSTLGRLLHLQAVFCSAGAGSAREIERLGDQVVADILPHPLSLFGALLRPGSIERAAWAASRPASGELRARATVGRTTLSLLVSMSARPTRATLWLAGTEGSVDLDLFHGFALGESGAVSRFRKAVRPLDLGARLVFTATSHLGRRALRGEPAYPGLNTLVRAFYQAIQRGGPSPIPAASAIAVTRSREQILAAAGLDLLLGARPR